MFEELNAHRAAVAENIEKAMEIGFTAGEDLEKAHQVGDVHPNGKWVWTQLPSGKYDWRVKKQGQEGKPAAQAKSGKEEKPEKKEAKGGSGDVSKFMDALALNNSKMTDESKIAVMKTEKGNWDTYYDGKRVGVIGGNVLDEKVAEEKGWIVGPEGDARAHSRGEKVVEKTEEKKETSEGNKETIEEKSEKKETQKYSGMTPIQARKALVGKTIKIGDKEAQIVDTQKWKDYKGQTHVSVKVVQDGDFINKMTNLSLEALDNGTTEYDSKYYGSKGQTIELSDEEPKMKEVTQDSLNEFVDFLSKNVKNKDSEDVINRAFEFMTTVPPKYRSSEKNIYNQVVATVMKLKDSFGW